MWTFSKYERILAACFLLTLPLLRPWIHGDGRGYYAYGRALLLQHNLDFELDWEKGYESDPKFHDPGFRENYLTPNGHIDNHWAIGPAILWTPFLVCGRAAALLYDHFARTSLAGDGFSRPYMLSMALGTFAYGFAALLFSMRLARRYFDERWAFLAAVGVWLASSFAFYLYAEPSFAHIPSAFLIALFLLIWDGSRRERAWKQWLALGVLAGLMLDTYYPNGMLLALLFFDAIEGLWGSFQKTAEVRWKSLVWGNLLFLAAALVCYFPTLVSKKILYGSYFHSGYKQTWYLNSPAFLQACFSSHGVFSWTPILLPAVFGLMVLRRTDRNLSTKLLLTVLAFFYLIGCYQAWHAIPSFGNRFFISLTPIFILGLATTFARLGELWMHERVWSPAVVATAFLIFWNFGLMYQFGAHLFPQDSGVSWKDIAYNQVFVLPSRAEQSVKQLVERKAGAASRERTQTHQSGPKAQNQ